jgi:hypothetical protein
MVFLVLRAIAVLESIQIAFGKTPEQINREIENEERIKEEGRRLAC